MKPRMSVWPCLLPVVFAVIAVPVSMAQSAPCAAITRNPKALDALLDSYPKFKAAESGNILTISELSHFRFKPIVIQPGDVLYIAYRGEPFDLTAHLGDGQVIPFPSASKARPDQWRNGIFPLDMPERAVNQKLVQLTATAKNLTKVFIRNIRIIRAGKPFFEFAQLSSYGRTPITSAAIPKLPCKGNDQYPHVATAYSEANRFAAAINLNPPPPALTLTAQQINTLALRNAPPIQAGDNLLIEANRGDFDLMIKLSDGSGILTGPHASSTAPGWRPGRIKLDFPSTMNKQIVGMQVRLLHEGGPPLLLRHIEYERQWRVIFALDDRPPAQEQTAGVIEPPMSYPPDPMLPNPHLATVSVSRSDLLGHQPDTGFLAPKLPSYSMNLMMFQSTTTSTGDPNHFKFTGAELDSETGLYHMGARYYNPALGRFMQPDPLYIEMHRLLDPQSLNLYGYARNNPTTLSDPTGLDIALGCKGGQADCNTARDQLNGREKAGFQVGLDKNNKLTAHVSKAEYNNLSTAEKKLYNAINDPNNHATLNVVNGDGAVTFGLHNSPGNNSVDIADTAKLDAASNKGGLNSGDAVAHEALESYISLSNDADAHGITSKYFPGFEFIGSDLKEDPSGRNYIGSTLLARPSDGRGDEYITTTYRTPIPKTDLQKGPIRVDRDVTGVTFEPKQKN